MWWRLRRRIWRRARPGSRSAPGRGAPSARTGLTRVVSTEVAQEHVLGHTGASLAADPGAVRSRGTLRGPNTPVRAHAARWSPKASSAPRQEHTRSLKGSGTRRRARPQRESEDRAVGGTVKKHPAWSPAWERSSAREAGSRSASKPASSAASSTIPAARCHPRIAKVSTLAARVKAVPRGSLEAISPQHLSGLRRGMHAGRALSARSERNSQVAGDDRVPLLDHGQGVSPRCPVGS